MSQIKILQRPKNGLPDSSRGLGLLPDSASDMAEVPLHISTYYQDKGRKVIKYAASQSMRGTGSTGGKKDSIPPTLSITAPTNGTVYPHATASVTITGEASDNVGVTAMYIYVNGILVKQSAFTASANTTRSVSAVYTFPNDGVFNITVDAKDGKGNTTSKTITITRQTDVVVVPPPGETLPTSYSLPIPPVRSQGSEGSCVAWAEAYGMSILTRIFQSAGSYDDNVNVCSPEFLFDILSFGFDPLVNTNANYNCGGGATVLNGLVQLKTYGTCLYGTLPYSSSKTGLQVCPCDTNNITSDMRTEAASHKLGSYYGITTADRTLVKQTLVNGHPIVTGFNVDANYYNATSGYIWNSWNPEYGGPHCNLIVGYDDTKHAFLMLNQWGASWGTNGLIWVDYDFFPLVIPNTIYAMSL